MKQEIFEIMICGGFTVKKCFASFLAVVLLITALGTVAFGASSQITKTNPLDTGKEILYYLFWTVDDKLEKDLQDMQTSLGLSDEQMNSLKNLGLAEHKNNRSLKSTYSSNTRSSVASFNSRIESAAVDRNKTIELILGDKYAEFRSWIASWWEAERKYRMNPTETKADIDRIASVWATQYVPNTPGAVEVALPDKYLKWANLGWDDTYDDPPYVVNVYSATYNTTLLGVNVDEVGPWNENDNYWDNDRRIFTDLNLGVPEAQAAYYDDYNNGKDEFGRIVLNPAGIDLSVEAAEDLGFGTYESGWVAVRYEYLP